MAKNIEHVLFLRNGSLYGTRALALEGINNNADKVNDGEFILARYGSGNDVKTLVGVKYLSGNDSSLTIFDIEGASADVNALIQEINAKLGDGITSANTATAQLTALSGTSADGSGVTSVWGAKAYAKDYTDEQIGKLDYTDAAVAGEYVSQVSQADGKIAVTRVELPSLAEVHEAGKPIIAVAEDKGQLAASAGTINAEFVNVTGFTATNAQGALEEVKDAIGTAISGLDYTDTAVAKQFVAAVDETDGVISITRGEIESSGKTVVITADGNDINLEVNIDNDTIVKNANGVISVASAALTQYVGDGKTIDISAADEHNNKTVSTLLTLSSVTPSSTTVKEEYALKNASGETIGSTIKIYKDSHIVSITYITDPSDKHYQNLEYVYIDADGETQTEYVDISALVLEAEFASGVTVTNHVAHGVVDPTSETFLTVGADGFKLSGVQDAIDAAYEALDADKSGSTTHITVNVVEEDGVITAVNVEEDDIASAQGLADEITARTTADTELSNRLGTGVTTANTATAQLIALSGDPATAQSGDTSVEGAKAYADAKLADAVAGLDADVSGNSTHVTVGVEEVNGKITAVTVSEDNIANANDLAGLSGKTLTGVTVNNAPLAVSNNVASVTISGATSSLTANTTNAIVVDTDANGNITLGLNYIDCGTYDN